MVVVIKCCICDNHNCDEYKYKYKILHVVAKIVTVVFTSKTLMLLLKWYNNCDVSSKTLALWLRLEL